MISLSPWLSVWLVGWSDGGCIACGGAVCFYSCSPFCYSSVSINILILEYPSLSVCASHMRWLASTRIILLSLCHTFPYLACFFLHMCLCVCCSCGQLYLSSSIRPEWSMAAVGLWPSSCPHKAIDCRAMRRPAVRGVPPPPPSYIPITPTFIPKRGFLVVVVEGVPTDFGGIITHATVSGEHGFVLVFASFFSLFDFLLFRFLSFSLPSAEFSSFCLS